MRTVLVVGGGPAGSAAAISALQENASVALMEKSKFPRHKVCGEFLSPEIYEQLEHLGCAEAFLNLGPAVIDRMILHFGKRTVDSRLPQSGFGLSRFELDRLLLQRAVDIGAKVVREQWTAATRCPNGNALVMACGRNARAPAGNRLFGFKAHYSGPPSTAVELFFFNRCYVGVSSVENGITNVCGLAPESILRQEGFDPDDLVLGCAPLAHRLQPLDRAMDWLMTGPLVFSKPDGADNEAVFRAGDALGFLDPFTGSGILNALITGRLAGRAAAQGWATKTYRREYGRILQRPFFVSAILRAALGSGHADLLASAIPGRWLFRVTRPRLR